MAIAVCAVIGTLLPAAYGMVRGIPEPLFHDEYSYLLSADTFARGRLSNPAPPLPEFFEAPHVLVTPTYSSKYPPGQGLALALGQVTGRHPIWGVWLSCGLFAASLCWMLQGWTSREWAFAITVVAIATLGVSSYWAQSYWGGMVAASGGALLFGGMRRLCRSPRIFPALLMGLGVAVLANTRPYEGLLVCVPAAGMLGCTLIRSRSASFRASLALSLLPFGAVLLIGAAFMTTHNRAVTGDWLRAPYSVHQNQYFHQGVFLFSPIREPERRALPRVAHFYDISESSPRYGLQLIDQAARNLYVRLPATIESALGVLTSTGGGRERYRGVLLWLVALVIAAFGSRWVWFCIISVCFVALGESVVWWWFPHYAAPVLALVLAAMAMTFRAATLRSHALDRSRRFAPAAVVLLAALFVLLPALFPGDHGGQTHEMTLRGVEAQTRSFDRINAPRAGGPVLSRGTVRRRLERLHGSHLVFVQYDDRFTIVNEWVYNSADLDTARVIFAHDLGDSRNQALIAAYPERSVWMVRVSESQTQLDPYPVREYGKVE